MSDGVWCSHTHFGVWILDTGYLHRPFHLLRIAQCNAEERFQNGHFIGTWVARIGTDFLWGLS
jgi:hypothetical protein